MSGPLMTSALEERGVDEHPWSERFRKITIAQFEPVERLGVEVTRRVVDDQPDEELLVILHTTAPVTCTGHSRPGCQNPCLAIVLQQLAERSGKPREPSPTRVLIVVGLFVWRPTEGDVVGDALPSTPDDLSACGPLSLPVRKTLTRGGPIGGHFSVLVLP